MASDFSLTLLVLLAVHLVAEQAECSVAVEKGPPQRRKKLETVLAKPGEDVKIVCPVYGSPQPIIEWSKVCNVHHISQLLSGVRYIVCIKSANYYVE